MSMHLTHLARPASLRMLLAGITLATYCHAVPFGLPPFLSDDDTLPPAPLRKPSVTRQTEVDRIGLDVFERAVQCWPAQSLFRGEIAFEGRLHGAPLIQLDSNGQWSQHRYSSANLVARLPLYSSLEVDRERERELNRRLHAADAAGEFSLTLMERERLQRELRLMTALEQRARERVRAGVAESSEQVRYLERVAALDGELLRLRGRMTRAQLQLVSFCSSDKAAEFTRFLQVQMGDW
ncbi:MAG: hypothetical protein FGM28_11385 [Limnohabitans sp.]|nr:hypothetical protein [Limnohabitans sp.]